MRAFVIVATLLLASTCSASLYGAVSTQYHSQDHVGGYAYGYAEPLSQKHEARSADGTTQGSYSYVDANGLLQSVSYVADPHNGFRATGTNFPQAPAPVATLAAHAPAPWAYTVAPYHVPVITPLGVPADTPEVAAAKAAHFAAHAAARYGHHLHKRSLWGGHAAWAQAPAPVIHNGVPVDTPEVQHAKAAHFAAYAKAAAETAVAPHGGYAPAPAAPHGGYHIPVIANGVPVETPEVQHAKAAHFAAVAKASAAAAAAPAGPAPAAYSGAYAHPGAYAHAPAAPYNGPIHIPVIQNGVPVEPAEVQHARAAHLAALHGTGSGAGVYGNGHWDQDGQYRHDVNGW